MNITSGGPVCNLSSVQPQNHLSYTSPEKDCQGPERARTPQTKEVPNENFLQKCKSVRLRGVNFIGRKGVKKNGH